MTSKPGWTPSATLPKTRTSFVGVGYDEMVARARALAPAIAARAAECERLRRLPDETERELHAAGLFRIAQPARVGGPEATSEPVETRLRSFGASWTANDQSD